LVRSDEDCLMGTYHCRECGEAIVYSHPPNG
jgi:rRNA maturation protein Nop10